MKKNLRKTRKKTLKILIVIGLVLIAVLLVVLSVVCVKKIKGMSSSIDLSVGVIDDLKISADGINYGTKLNKDSFNVTTDIYKSRNQLPDVLSRVSTSGGISDGRLDMYYEILEKDGKEYYVSSEKQKDNRCFAKECKDSYYMAFDVFFEASEPESIALTENSYVKQKKDNGLENAIRIGFVVEGTTSSTDKKDIQGLAAGIKAVIWEPNSDVHTKEAKKITEDVYGEDIEDKVISYRGINSEFNKIKIIDRKSSNNFSNISSDIVTKKEFRNKQSLFMIQQGITKVRVYIWFESGDKDSLLEKKATNFDINLEFAKA